ncbi:hypothetical protein [Streptomyces sp. DSM 40484]|uniref:hypothetical protein n=1 Tax=Streptomyces kroppenstedtii TaxID=3051181 RepID=UPI0028D09DE6|nr:hypothetical protein [Streptomyces sp. DSM 40484]
MLLSSASGDGRVFLGEDVIGWRTAFIAAVIAAVVYELVMAATRRISLRLPFLVLYLARLTVPRKQWRRLHGEWVAELHHILSDHETRWIIRLLNGLRYAAPLALGGAHNTVKAENTSRRSLARQVLSDNKLPLATGQFSSMLTVQAFLTFELNWIHGVFVVYATLAWAYVTITIVTDYRHLRAVDRSEADRAQ